MSQSGKGESRAVSRKRKRVSKKNKSSWRKHSDIRDIEGFLEEERREERTGGPASAKTNDELFFVDAPSQVTTAPPTLTTTQKGKKQLKPLRCHSALLPDPFIKPARVSANVRTASTAAKKQCKQKKERLAAGILTQKQKLAASQRAAAKEQLKKQKTSTILSRAVMKYDLWGDTDITKPPADLDEHYVDICKLRRIKPPVYYHKKPSGLTVVEVAPPGASYNPAYDDHQELLSKALVIEEAKTKEEERIARAMDDKFPLAGDVPNESTWLKEMSIGLLDDNEDEGSKPDFTAEELSQLSNNPPVRREDKKTEKERRRLKEIEVKGKNVIKAKKENLRKQELFRLKSIKREVKQRVTNLAARKEKRRLEKEANKDKTKKLGKIKFAEPTMALKLSEELEGSLRLLKPEGHILEDRFKSLQRRNIIEPRLRAKRIRRYTPKIIEKKGHRAVTE